MVTIIILLILAGITISQLQGSGIFERAKEARDKYRNAQEDEEERIAKYSNEIDSYVGGNRDLELDYSNSEKIVGKWFGENLYQKTYTSNTVGQTEIDTIQNIKLLNVIGSIINDISVIGILIDIIIIIIPIIVQTDVIICVMLWFKFVLNVSISFVITDSTSPFVFLSK